MDKQGSQAQKAGFHQKPSRVYTRGVPRSRKSPSYEEKYREYRNGAGEPQRDEIYQIGFRLAKHLKHERVYGVDANPPEDFEAAVNFANQNGQSQIFEEMMRKGQGMIKRMDQQLASMTITDFLKQINSTQALLENHQFYLGYFVKIGKDRNYPGADAVGQWYQRNLRIFANINRIAQPGDRILVLFGQGHCHILRQLVKDAPDNQLADPAHYL